MLQPATSRGIKLRLQVMMFLQYFVQGCFLPVIAVYLQESMGIGSEQLGAFVAGISLGPLLASFIVGQLADRRLATEKVLALSHLGGAALMFSIYASIHYFGANANDGFGLVLGLGVGFSIFYTPSVMLTNALAFHHLQSAELEFPRIRLWGTIGFIVPAWLVEYFFLSGNQSALLANARGVTLLFAAGAGAVMGLYCLTLPHTPPKQGASKIAVAEVLALLKEPAFRVLVIVAFGIAIVHQFFFTVNGPFLKAMLFRGGEAGWEARISSIGQVTEIGVMAGLGLLILRLGFKGTFTLGIVAYIARCLLLALAASIDGQFATSMTLVCLGQALHGFCFGCFLAAGFMFVDRCSPRDARGSMQTFFGTFVLGLGFFVGGWVGGWTGQFFSSPNHSDLGMVAGTSGWTAVFEQAGPPADSVRGQLGIESTAGWTAVAGRDERRDWVGVWLASAAIGLVCLLIFVVFFPRTGVDRPPES